MYEPKPIDTSAVVLDDELLSLVEFIATNTHDVWAAARIKEGWQYGTKRNEGEKITPNLVPYEDLPESEKDYDRNTATEAIKVLISLGYKIAKPLLLL